MLRLLAFKAHKHSCKQSYYPTVFHSVVLVLNVLIRAAVAQGMITPVTFSAARGASILLFTMAFLHTVIVVELQALDVPLRVFGETA